MILKRKISIITGAAKGIGRAIAFDLASKNFQLILADSNYDELAETASSIEKSHNQKVSKFKIDISNEKEVIKLFSDIINKFKKIDILINNAGVYSCKPFLETTIEDWDKIINVNLKGTFLCCREALKTMTKYNYGKIINISSNLGKKGAAKRAAYSASKAGIISITETLTDEFKDYDININAVLPDTVNTDLFRNAFPSLDYSKFMKPEDVSKVVVFLTQENSAAIKGASIEIYNGQNLKSDFKII